jgi:hypothetical protein
MIKSLHLIFIVYNLPNICNKPEAQRLGAKHVSDDQHEEILDKIAHRAALDHNEMPDNESDSSSDSQSSSADDSNTDSDESSTDKKRNKLHTVAAILLLFLGCRFQYFGRVWGANIKVSMIGY